MPLSKHKEQRAPAFFIGHGNPMNAIETNSYTDSLQELGKSIEKPKAVLVISAHWQKNSNGVSIHDVDEGLIYDMFGFPDSLYEVEYPAPNAKFLVPRLQSLISSLDVQQRSLDHGVWSVLVHLFEKADIPVIQLAINNSLTMQEHYEIGRELRVLRDEGVMIIGSGNVTHNLRDVSTQKNASVAAWAKEFHNYIKEAIVTRDFGALIEFQKRQRYAYKAHPTPEHYIPLLYVAGASYKEDKSYFPYEAIENGSISMLSWFVD